MLRSLLLIAAVFGAVLLFWSHSRLKRAAAMKPVEWPNLKEEWLDVDLPVKEVQELSPGHFRVVTQGLYDGKILGLTFEFNNIDANRAFLANPQTGKIAATRVGVELISQGQPTVNFVQVYASLAHKSPSSISVPAKLDLTAITLGGNPQSIETQTSKIKVFHADEDSEGPFYFEAFINPDVPRGYIEFHEKDPEYRDGLLRSFGAKL